MYSIWNVCDSEEEWYSKMVVLLEKQNLYQKSKLWDVALSNIYAEFCEITCGESAPSIDFFFDECGLAIDECIEEDGIGVTREMISRYMDDYDLVELSAESYKDMFDYFEDDLREKLCEKCEDLVNEFWSVLDKRFKSTYEKVLFFYVREEHFQFAIECKNPSASLDIFVEDTNEYDREYIYVEEDDCDNEDETDEDSEETIDERGTGEEHSEDQQSIKTTLYSFLNHYDATGFATSMRVYEWIENNS